MGTSEAFSLMPPDEPLFLEDDGEWHSFAEVLGDLDPEFHPEDYGSLRLFLACYDAWPAHEREGAALSA